MREAFADLKQIFPDMPDKCDQALMETVRLLPEKSTRAPLRAGRRLVILAAVFLMIACAAAASFYPQIIGWFANRYGDSFASWMEKGSAVQTAASAEVGGAVFSMDEVLVRGRGLYAIGTIRASDGYVIADSECSPEEPWGYNIHYGETAAEGTPTIAEKAALSDSVIRYVHCDLVGISVDGGASLMPGSWGYGIKAQRDGSIVFSIEVEDGLAVEPGSEYTLELCAQSYGTNADNSISYENLEEKNWSVTVKPEQLTF